MGSTVTLTACTGHVATQAPQPLHAEISTRGRPWPRGSAKRMAPVSQASAQTRQTTPAAEMHFPPIPTDASQGRRIALPASRAGPSAPAVQASAQAAQKSQAPRSKRTTGNPSCPRTRSPGPQAGMQSPQPVQRSANCARDAAQGGNSWRRAGESRPRISAARVTLADTEFTDATEYPRKKHPFRGPTRSHRRRKPCREPMTVFLVWL